MTRRVVNAMTYPVEALILRLMHPRFGSFFTVIVGVVSVYVLMVIVLFAYCSASWEVVGGEPMPERIVQEVELEKDEQMDIWSILLFILSAILTIWVFIRFR